MSIPPTSIKFNVTNQYINEIRSSDCSVSSIVAKVSLIAFPVIALITLMFDLVTSLLEGNLSDKIISILNNEQTTELEKISQLFDVIESCNGKDITNAAAELCAEPEKAVLILENALPLIAFAQDKQTDISALGLGKMTEKYPFLISAYEKAAQHPEFAAVASFFASESYAEEEC